MGTTGYPLTSTNDSTTSPSDSEGQDETTAPPECELRGSICGEMSVCQCDCDFGTECCTCLGAQCTNDTHCEAGESCVDVSDSFIFVALQCVSGGQQLSRLTNIEALGTLGVAMGGSIRDNPMLPTAQIEALLASIDRGGLVEYCGNLDGDPCPE